MFQSSQSDWLKVEYLLEFAEWLYCNELRLDDCRDQLEWAIDILMNIKTETEQGQGQAIKISFYCFLSSFNAVPSPCMVMFILNTVKRYYNFILGSK